MQEINGELIRQAVAENREDLVAIAQRLIQTPSAAPEASTTQMAEVVRELLCDVEGAQVWILTQEEPVTNVLAVLDGSGPGRRLVINGHLDTYPVANAADWTHGPFAGEVEDGRIYGRGACDMKCGVACALTVFRQMAKWRQSWSGQLVLTLVGDEQKMGVRGSQYLLETQPLAGGDAMLSADVGSPDLLCFGEKGYIWMEVRAWGVMTHGAQVNKGINAINRLMAVVSRLNEELPRLPFTLPPEVDAALVEAARTQDPRDIALLRSITVNLGYIEGGVSANLIPDKALAKLDIRLPAGVTCAAVEEKIRQIMTAQDGVEYEIWRSCDPGWSDQSHDLFTALKRAAREALGGPVRVTYRVGASDARFYRNRHIPTATCGLAAHNHGSADEYAQLEEMERLVAIYLATALEFLKETPVAAAVKRA